MLGSAATETFTMERIGRAEWVIRDGRVSSDDPQGLVARILETDDDLVQVIWFDGSARPALYLSASAVLEDVRVTATRCAPGTRPIEIPHFAPPRRS